MAKPSTSSTKPVARSKGKPGRPPSPNPRPKQIQIRATPDEQDLWSRIGEARSAVAGVDLSQQQVFRWMMSNAAETLGLAHGAKA